MDRIEINRANGRAADALRPVKLTREVMKHALGSCMVEFGDTRVLCAATIEEGQPLDLDVANAVAHADYWGRGGVRITVRPGSVSASNPGTFRIPVSEAVEGGHSDPRNETLLRMLNYIGRAERAGSGVRNVFRICMGLDLAPPSFEEGRHPDSVTVTIRFAGDRDRGVSDTLAVLIARDGRITIPEMVEATGLTRNRILSELDVMKAEGRLRRVGGPRGRWELRW